MNMAGRPVRMVDVPQINVLDTLGLISTSFGHWDGVAGGEHAELPDAPAFRYLRLEFDGDRLVGSQRGRPYPACRRAARADHAEGQAGRLEGQADGTTRRG